MNRKIIFTIGIYLVAILTIGYILAVNYLHSVEKKIYTHNAQKMQNICKNLIDNKQKNIAIMTYALSLTEDAKTALLTHYFKHLQWKELSQKIAHTIGYKHLWFHIIDKEGFSLYRSWTEKKFDNVLSVRKDIKQLIQQPKKVSTIGVGKYTLSFKTILPVWYHYEHIGFIETISNFDSIVTQLHKNGYKSLVLIDKSYNAQLEVNIHNRDILGYRVANSNITENIFSLLENKNIDKIIQKTYLVDRRNDFFIVTHKLYNKDDFLGYVILTKPLSEIDIAELNRLKEKIIYVALIGLFLMILILFYLYNIKYKKFVNKQNNLLIEKVEERTKSLTFMALHDNLTKLPNRKLLSTHLNKIMKNAKKNEETVFVIFLDLDNFKEINDAYGHKMGDKVLQTVSRKIESLMSDKIFFARVSGDEFVLSLENYLKREVEHFVKILLKEIQAPMYIDHTQLYVGVSAGISFFPVHGQSADTLLKESDTAMYVAKSKGKNCYQFYEAWMNMDKQKRQELAKELRHALLHDEIVVYFQPKIDIKKKSILGFESLVRWEHPSHGLMYPDAFLSLAENLGIMEDFDDYVRKKSMQQMQNWRQEGLEVGELSINISPRELVSKNFISKLQYLCDEVDFDMNHLEIEILENQIMEDTSIVIDILEDVKELGISIAIDDFGTGYSSFSYLQELPIQKLKIDKTFIDDLVTNEKSVKIVRMITLLAHQLGLQVIAEGVETEEQVKILLQEGCFIVQGYYISKPMSAKDTKKFILNWGGELEDFKFSAIQSKIFK